MHKRFVNKITIFFMCLTLVLGFIVPGVMGAEDKYTVTAVTNGPATFMITNDSTGEKYGGFCAVQSLPWGREPGLYTRSAYNDAAAAAAALGVSEQTIFEIRYAIAEMNSVYVGDQFSVDNARMSFPDDTLTLGRPLGKLLTQYLIWARLSIARGGTGINEFRPTASEQAYFYRDTLLLTDTLDVEITAPNGYDVDSDGYMGPFTLQYSAGSAASLKEINNLGQNKDIPPSFKVAISGSAVLYNSSDGTGTILDSVQLGDTFYIMPKRSGAHTISLIPNSTIITGIAEEALYWAGSAHQPILSVKFNYLDALEFPYDMPGYGFDLSKEVAEWTGSTTGDYFAQIRVEPNEQALFRIEIDAEAGGMNVFFGTPQASPDDYVNIYTPSQFAEIANDLTGKYRLMNNIDMSAYILHNPGWASIGTEADPFTGILDGNGYTLSGVTINQPSTAGVGLFGWMSIDAVVRDLAVDSFDITGGPRTGAIAGYSLGTIVNCSVTNSRIEGTSYTGGVVGRSDTVALELNDLTVSGSTVIVHGPYGGGVAGLVYNSTMQNCIADGVSIIVDPPDVMSQVNGAGGIVAGVTSTNILDCIANDVTISCTKGTSGYYGENYTYNAMVGGIVGYYIHSSDGPAVISRCSVTNSDISAWMAIGGVAGIVLSSTGGSANSFTISNCSVTDTTLHAFGSDYGYGSPSTTLSYIYSLGGIVGGTYRSNPNAVGYITQCHATPTLEKGPMAGGISTGDVIGRASFSLTISETTTSGNAVYPAGPTDPSTVGADVMPAAANDLWAGGIIDGYISDVYTEYFEDGTTTQRSLTTDDLMIEINGVLTPVSTLPKAGGVVMVDVKTGNPLWLYYMTDALQEGEYINAVTLNGRTETAKVIVRDFTPLVGKYYVDVVKYADSIQDMLDGSVFTLYQYSGRDWTGTATELAVITPNAGDRVEITAPGWYALRETTTPNGFVPDDTYYRFYFDGTGFIEDSSMDFGGNWFSYHLTKESDEDVETFTFYSINHTDPDEPPPPGTGTLKVSKTFSVPADSVAVTFTVTDSSGPVDLTADGILIRKTGGSGTFGAPSAGGNTFTLTHDTTVTITGLPIDETYTVTETIPSGCDAPIISTSGTPVANGASVAFSGTMLSGNIDFENPKTPAPRDPDPDPEEPPEPPINVPSTGDGRTPLHYCISFAAALAGMGLITVWRRQKKRNIT